MDKKICLVIPYFGKMPQYTTLFFESLKRNKSIDVLLITDSKVNISLSNLKILEITFDKLVKIIQNNFDFEIKLDNPYKLCDYRPAYGVIFHEYLKEYDFWGYCDLDIIFGDISKYLSLGILNNYEKIYQHGHLTLFKNIKSVNYEFMSPYGMNYRDVFTTSINCVFDEVEGIQRKFDHDNFHTYKGVDYFDVNPWKYHLTRVTSDIPQNILNNNFDFKNECFFWENGHLYRIAFFNGKKYQDEFIYFHFQKRKYQDLSKSTKFSNFMFLVNNGWNKEKACVTKNNINRFNNFSIIKEIAYFIKMEKYIWVRRYKKYILKKG